MYDIDPPARILRLNAPRKGTQPTALTDRQHLARISDMAGNLLATRTSQGRPIAQRHLARIAQADPIAVRHSVGAAIVRLNTLARADGALARQFDAL